MNIHFKGVFFLTQALLPLMADGGRIVNVSTGLTRFALPGIAAYASMKGAIEVLTKVPRQGTRRSRHSGECGGPRRDRDRLRRAASCATMPRSTPSSPADRLGARRRAGRYRRRHRLTARGRQPLDQRPAHRGIGRHVPLMPDDPEVGLGPATVCSRCAGHAKKDRRSRIQVDLEFLDCRPCFAVDRAIGRPRIIT